MNTKRLLIILFSLTLITQSTLLFFIQPMIGKMLIPLVGGTSSVWNVIMAFFQINLLVGYGLANVTSALNKKWQVVFLLSLYIVGFLILPFSFDGSHLTAAITDNSISYSLFKSLFFSVSLPFLALSMTTPTLQRLYTLTGRKDSKDPYFLYAISNIGSFLGLLSYPIIFEPLSKLEWQLDFWMWSYLITIIFIALCLITTHFFGTKSAMVKEKIIAAKSTISLTWKQRGNYIFLAAIPSSLMLGATTTISQELSAFPLLLVIPLALYLGTYIYAFSKNRKVSSEKLMFPLVAVTLATAVVYCTTLLQAQTASMTFFAGLILTSFVIAALTCHIRLSELRPNSDKLTEFYLMLSIGGAIGGCFNAFLIPIILDSLIEFPLILSLSLLAFKTTSASESAQKRFSSVIRTVIAILIAIAIGILVARSFKYDQADYLLSVSFFITASILILRVKALSIILFCSILLLPIQLENIIYKSRNFFGIIQVNETTNEKYTERTLRHGSTIHGYELLDVPEYKSKPVGYYHPKGPINDVNMATEPKNIAIFGLGTGQLACFFSQEQNVSFFEIDPEMVHVAKNWFSFLDACPPEDIIIGDARITLRDVDEQFDLIIMDAFSSDSVPTHLLTIEAIEEYKKKLSPNGIILFHISNRYYDLSRPIYANSQYLNSNSKAIYYKPVENQDDKSTLGVYVRSIWSMIDINNKYKDSPHFSRWQSLPYPNDTGYKTPWTDSYSNLIGNYVYQVIYGHTATAENK